MQNDTDLSVEIENEKLKLLPKVPAYIGIGSNLNTPFAQVKQAIETCHALPKTEIIACSSLYSCPPFGDVYQPDYVNAVVLIHTQLSPLELLHQLQQIELMQGRIRTQNRFAARTLDMDILLYGNETILSDDLTIPHYSLEERSFFIYPILEIDPELILPNGKPLKHVAKKVKNDLKKL